MKRDPGAGGGGAAKDAALQRTAGVMPDGSLRVALQRLDLSGLSLNLGPMTVEIGQGVLSGVIVRMKGSGQGFELLGLAAQEAKLQGTARMPVPALAAGAGAGAGKWRLDALGGLDGAVQAAITDAAWIVDADVHAPIRNGQLDFNRVVVEHIGPNSSMGVSHMGVYVDAPNGRNYLFVFNASHVAGTRFERRDSLLGSRVTDRGALDLQAFLEGMLGCAIGSPLGRLAHHVKSKLDRTRLTGEFRLGNGTIGNARHHAVLQRLEDGDNRMNLSAALLGHEVVVRLPRLAVASAAFELLGMAGTTGAVSGSAVVNASGLGGSGAVLALDGSDVVVRDLTLGDVAPPAAAA